jgi:glycosyltransferase involved in cell wall biosynthesis
MPEISGVDGHSIDRTVEIARELADKVVFDNGGGLGDARNVGAKTATSNIVAYCDADCRPWPNWTADIAKLLKKYIAVSGPLIAYDGGVTQKLNFRVWMDTLPRFLSKLSYNSFFGNKMAFRRDVLLANLFRVRFMEDYEMSCRYRRIGKIKFSKHIMMRTSARRFIKNGFYRTCLLYYLPAGICLKLGLKVGNGYLSK